MNEPPVSFEEFNGGTRNICRFFDDCIECDWKVIIRAGKNVYPPGNIAGHLAKETTFAYVLDRTLCALATHLIGGLVLHLGFRQPILNRIGFVLYACAAFATILAVMKMK
jgi:hypothetical protein